MGDSDESSITVVQTVIRSHKVAECVQDAYTQPVFDECPNPVKKLTDELSWEMWSHIQSAVKPCQYKKRSNLPQCANCWTSTQELTTLIASYLCKWCEKGRRVADT